jgi:acyl phosphate:glycerol-3-phosphate acyltransferase
MELLLLVFAYFLGSVPTGYLVGRINNIDIREHGSGSTGAANIWRTIGKTEGMFVFVADLIKGSIAILLMQSVHRLTISLKIGAIHSSMINLESIHQWFVVGAAFLVVLGHSYSCWIGFSGGKSVATGLGVLVALNWIVALGAFGLWVSIVAMWRITSIASMLVAIAVPVLMVLTHSSSVYSLFTCATSTFIIYRHRGNLDRLRQGSELQVIFFDVKQHENTSTN